MASLDVLLLGPLRVLLDGEEITPGSPKHQAVLGVLAASPRPMRRAELAELVWPESGLRNLRQAIYSIRQLPGAEHWLVLDGSERVGLRCRTDLLALREQLREGRYDSARALVRGPVLDGLGGAFGPAFDDWLAELEGRVDALTAPLQELMDEAPWRLAQALALAEGRVEVATLGALLGMSNAEVLAATEQLERDHMLGAEGLTSRAAARVRAQTSAVTASALHVRLGELLAGADPAGAALHFEAAGEAERAAEQWRLAGELDAALRCAKAPALRASLLGEALDAAETGAMPERAASLLAELRALARRTGLPEVVGEASLRGATAAMRAGRQDEALDLAEEADALAAAHGLEALRARVGGVLGQALIFSGKLDGAEQAFRRVVALAQGDVASTLRARAGLGAVAGMRGEAAVAAEHHREALLLARGLGDRRLVARLSLNLGCDLERLGRDRAAAARFVEAAEHAGELGDLSVRFVALVNLVTCKLHLGEIAEAVTALREAEALPRGIWPGDAGMLAAGWAELARAVGLGHACADAHREAGRAFEAAGDQRRARVARANEAVSRFGLGQVGLAEALSLVGGPLIQPAGDGIRLELALSCVVLGVDPAEVLAGMSGLPVPPRFVALRVVVEGLWAAQLGGAGPEAAALSAAAGLAGELEPVLLVLQGCGAAEVAAACAAVAQGLEAERRAALEARLARLCGMAAGR